MNKNHTIRSLSGILMLLLFAISITPKQIIHTAITGHKHSYVKSEADQSVKQSKNNYQCNWDQQAVESPFLDEPDFQVPQPPVFFSFHIKHYIQSYYSAELIFSSLRGPPFQS